MKYLRFFLLSRHSFVQNKEKRNGKIELIAILCVFSDVLQFCVD